jgi:phosphopantothenoylcysteine decarboxylase/phosphopantothenate--cysteine ligase
MASERNQRGARQIETPQLFAEARAQTSSPQRGKTAWRAGLRSRPARGTFEAMSGELGPKILLGVSGSVAAVKALDLVRRLRELPAQVRVAMTPGAKRMIAPVAFEAMSQGRVYHDVWDAEAWRMEHLEWAKWADLFVIAPASANLMADLAAGRADNAVTTTALAYRGPLLLCPAMNPAMFSHPATQANVATLRSRGTEILGPVGGTTLCGDEGAGRLADIADIVERVRQLVAENASASAPETAPAAKPEPASASVAEDFPPTLRMSASEAAEITARISHQSRSEGHSEAHSEAEKPRPTATDGFPPSLLPSPDPHLSGRARQLFRRETTEIDSVAEADAPTLLTPVAHLIGRRPMVKTLNARGSSDDADQPELDEPRPSPLNGLTVLVTAGATREPIDPVRFISNPSSGKMGFALAEEAADRGARVELVAGATEVPAPEHPNIRLHRVQTAAEMFDATLAVAPEAKVCVFAAAVSDYTPANPAPQKIKKEESGGVGLKEIKLVKTADIALEVGKMGVTGQLRVGFAAETENVVENALDKLRRKRFHLICANDVSLPEGGFGSDENALLVLRGDGSQRSFSLQSKRHLAARVLNMVEDELVAIGRGRSATIEIPTPWDE